MKGPPLGGKGPGYSPDRPYVKIALVNSDLFFITFLGMAGNAFALLQSRRSSLVGNHWRGSLGSSKQSRPFHRTGKGSSTNDVTDLECEVPGTYY